MLHILLFNCVFKAFQSRFYGPNIVWILRGWYSPTWWRVNDTKCTIEEIKKVMQNILFVDHVNYGSDEEAKILGLVSKILPLSPPHHRIRRSQTFQ